MSSLLIFKIIFTSIFIMIGVICFFCAWCVVNTEHIRGLP